VFYDQEYSAHVRYGVDREKDAVFFLRPDVWVGTVMELDGFAGQRLEKYLGGFLVDVDVCGEGRAKLWI
jgi:phenol 2-monooxygenase